MKNLKIFLALALLLLVLVVVMQNTGVVSVRFLFWRVQMSQIVLLPLILVLGLVIGFIAGTLTHRRLTRPRTGA